MSKQRKKCVWGKGSCENDIKIHIQGLSYTDTSPKIFLASVQSWETQKQLTRGVLQKIWFENFLKIHCVCSSFLYPTMDDPTYFPFKNLSILSVLNTLQLFKIKHDKNIFFVLWLFFFQEITHLQPTLVRLQYLNGFSIIFSSFFTNFCRY